MFSKLDLWVTAAVLVRKAFHSHLWTGFRDKSIRIRIVASRTFVCSRIQAGGRSVSISMAAVDVVRWQPRMAFIAIRWTVVSLLTCTEFAVLPSAFGRCHTIAA